jgi:hypothetical protein
MKSPSTDCPVEAPTFDLNVSSGSFLMQFNLFPAEASANELQEVLVMSESNVDWNAVVLGAVRGNAPPL